MNEGPTECQLRRSSKFSIGSTNRVAKNTADRLVDLPYKRSCNLVNMSLIRVFGVNLFFIFNANFIFFLLISFLI